MLILVAGPPASGKTYCARHLSHELNIPMLSKDAIKEVMFDTVGFGSRAEKVALGVAAFDVMLMCASSILETGGSVILENNYELATLQSIAALINCFGDNALTVRMTTAPEVLYRRYIERDRSSERHRGHVVNTQYPEKEPAQTPPTVSFEEFFSGMAQRGMLDIALSPRELRVDTTDLRNVVYSAVIDHIKMLRNKEKCQNGQM